jgi:GAF domain
MRKIPNTPNEPERLSALLEYHILDTPAEYEFDSIARLAAAVCQTPMATICFVDADRQWLKARYGIFISETPRDQAICAYTILNRGLYIVADTLEHRTFRNFSFVKGGPGIRFYAGIPISSQSGRRIGTLCVMDHYPRDLNSHQRQTLIALGTQIETLLEHRRSNTRLRELQDTQTRLLHHLLADVTSAFSATGTFLNLLSDDQPGRTSLLSLTPMASRQFHHTFTILHALVEWGKLRTLNRIRDWRMTDTRAILREASAQLGQHPAVDRFTLHEGQQLSAPLLLPDADLHFILKYLLLWLCDCAKDGDLTVSFILPGQDRLNIRIRLSSATISSVDLPGRLAPDTAVGPSNTPTRDIFLRLAADILINGKGDIFLGKEPGWLELTIDFPLNPASAPPGHPTPAHPG